jgi:ATP-dependent DNA helicase PIF1
MLSKINPHPFDSRIKFRDEGHKYWIDGDDKDLISCTTYIHSFFEHFDSDKIIKNILSSEKYNDPEYKYYKMSYDDIKSQWDNNCKEASESGTKLHENIEHFYNKLKVENNSDEFKQFLQFYEDHKHLEIYRTEWMIFSDILRITGSIDAVFKNNDGTLTLGDWKRSKEIHMNSFGNKWGKFPFQHIEDCNFYHYSLQLNLYRTILENFYEQKVKDMFLVILHPNNKDNKYIKINVKRMEKEGDFLLDYRKNQLMKMGYHNSLFKDIKLAHKIENCKNNSISEIDFEDDEIEIKPLLRHRLLKKDIDNKENDTKLENKGKRWTSAEDHKLIIKANTGCSIEELSEMHKRSVTSIKLRLMYLKFNNEKPQLKLFPQINLEEFNKYKESEEIKNKEKIKNKIEKDEKKQKKTEIQSKMSLSVTNNMTLNSLSEKQKYAYNLIIDKKNIFLTGCAGVGKTAAIKLFYKEYKNLKKIAMTSTTGVSAILIGGATLHSYLGIGLGKDKLEVLYMTIVNNGKLAKKWRDLQVLIIDEISMLDPELFDKLENLARLVRKNERPFGGIQLVLTGDFLQLPAVSSDEFCFQSKSWESCVDEVVYLTENFRQDDLILQKCLNEIRIGEISENTIKILKSRVGVKLTNELGIIPTKIYSLNKDVDYENQKEMDKLLVKNKDLEFFEYELEFNVLKKGMKFVQDKVKKVCLAPQTLQLCKGAQVMLLYNIDLENGLANGSRGVVIGFEEDFPIVRFLNGIERIITHQEWKIEDNGEVLMTITQIPLRVAFATTIHKIQGITLDYAEIDMGNIFEYGQGYVALSRVKKLEGLSIKNLDIDKIFAHPVAVEFYKNL